MYQRKVDVDMLNAVKSMLADVSSVSPLSEQCEWSRLWVSLNSSGLEAFFFVCVLAPLE